MLVDFWADWCGPCKRFAPIYEKASEEYADITFAKLDTDANQQLSGQLGIEGIPTLMAFREGVLVFNQAGALPGPALKQVVEAVKESRHGGRPRRGRQAPGRARNSALTLSQRLSSGITPRTRELRTELFACLETVNL